MKTWKEILEALGLSEEQQAKLAEALKDKAADGRDVVHEIVLSTNGEYVKAKKHDELNDLYKKLDLEHKAKIADYAKLEQVAGKSTELTAEIERIKTEGATERLLLAKKFAMERKWIEDGLPAINDSYEAYHLGVNYEKITQLQSGKFDGISEQHKSFKESNAKLYEHAKAVVIEEGSGANGQGKGKDAVTLDDFKKMTYSQQLAFKGTNPAQFDDYFNKI